MDRFDGANSGEQTNVIAASYRDQGEFGNAARLEA